MNEIKAAQTEMKAAQTRAERDVSEMKAEMKAA